MAKLASLSLVLQFRSEFSPNLMKMIFGLFSPPSALHICWLETVSLVLHNKYRGGTRMLWITQEADVGSKSSYLSHFLVTRGGIYALQSPLRQGGVYVRMGSMSPSRNM